MSRSNNTELENPSTRNFTWKGSEGKLVYWDSTKGDKGENVEVKIPFKFLVLDELACIRGYSNAMESGFWSNEIRKINEEALKVQTSKGVMAQGLYNKGELISTKNTTGAKYCQAVYIGYFEGGELKLGKLLLTGAGLGSWFEFRKKNKKIYEVAIAISSFTEGQEGAVKFKIPTFVTLKVSDETKDKANILDVELQKYFVDYFKTPAKPEEAVPVNTESSADIHIQHELQPEADSIINTSALGIQDDLPF